MRSLLATFLATLLCACPQQQGAATISIVPHPSAINDMGQTATLTLSAQTADGAPGTGTVTVSAMAGTVTETSVTLDATGSATSHFSCNVTSDANCKGRVEVTATWNSVSDVTRIQVGDSGIVTGTGGGSGGGGGMGGGGPQSDGGEPDGGDAGGGPQGDGGMLDGGFDAGGPRSSDAGSVQFIGSLDMSIPEYGLAQFDDPTHPIVGLPTSTDLPSTQLNALGQLVYYDALTHRLAVQVPDPYDHVGSGSRYPADTTTNDIALGTPACDGGALLGFWMRPDSTSYVYQCTDAGYFEGATTLQGLSGFQVLAAGFGSLLIADSMAAGYVADDAGHHPIVNPLPGGETFTSLIQDDRWREARATDGGYWVMRAFMDSETTGPCSLYFIDNAGNVGYGGLYTDLGSMAFAPVACTGRLDADGVLYTPASNNGDAVVVRRPLVEPSGTTTTVYTANGASPSTFASYPPHVFTFMDTTSPLVTGP